VSCFLQNKKLEVILLVILLCIAITNGALLPSNSRHINENYLVRCLTYISHRYFEPGRTVVISSPSVYRHVQQELVAEIQRTAMWPVVVTVDGNVSKPEKTDFIDRYGSYIILKPDGNIEYFRTEILGLILDRKRKLTRIWNSESRFVVAGANEFSMTQQKEIFERFSKLRIYNCIIVCQEHYVIDKIRSRPINVNDVDTGMKLGVYTWFPYQSSERCTEVKDITLMDSWVISAQGHFTKNTDLFPRKIGNRLNGCPMKAIVRDGQEEFTTKFTNRTYSNGTVVSYIAGLEMTLFRVVLRQMNMTFVHVPTPEGFELEKGEVRNLISSMFQKESYIVVGSVGNFYLNHPFFSSTNSYYIMSLRWYVPCFVKYPRWSSFFRILSVELWLVLFISIGIAAISATLVGRYSCTSEWQGYKTVTSSLTNLWAVILGVPVSTMPRTPSLRFLFFAWVCFSLAFSTVLQTFLITFLIDSGYKTPIQNMDELFESGIKLANPSGHTFIFENGDETETAKVHRNHVNCPSLDVCVAWAKYHKNVSILLLDKIFEEYYATGYFVGENSEPFLCRLEDVVVYSYGQIMLMFFEDPLMKRVNEITGRVVEAGLHTFWNSLLMHMKKLISRRIAIVHPPDGYYSFNLYHMQPAFYLLLMGLCVSALCFMVEVLYIRLLRKRN